MKKLLATLITAAITAQAAIVWEADLYPDANAPGTAVGYAHVDYTTGDARPVLTVTWTGFDVADYAEFWFTYYGGLYSSGQGLPPGGGSWLPQMWTLPYFDGAQIKVGLGDTGTAGWMLGTFHEVSTWTPPLDNGNGGGNPSTPEPTTYAIVFAFGLLGFALKRKLLPCLVALLAAGAVYAADPEDTAPTPIVVANTVSTVREPEKTVTLTIVWSRAGGNAWIRESVTGDVKTTAYKLVGGSEVPGSREVTTSLPFDLTAYFAAVENRTWGVVTNVWPGVRTTAVKGPPLLVLERLPAGLVAAARATATNSPPVLAAVGTKDVGGLTGR